MPMPAPLSVRSLHLKEVGSLIPTTTADHVGSCTPTSTNTHIYEVLDRKRAE